MKIKNNLIQASSCNVICVSFTVAMMLWQAPCVFAAINESDEIESYHSVAGRNRRSPASAYVGLIDARDIFIQQKNLYAAELDYESKVQRGEHPATPANYTSSNSRLASVKNAALSLKNLVHILQEVLALPENSTMDPKKRRMMEDAIASLPSTEPFLKQ